MSEWHGCYADGWQREIVPAAFAHPAKFSRALIRRIYEHAFEQGWLKPAMTVADPFAGIALGALVALWNGLHWVGVELEPRFVALGQQNLDLWQRKYGSKAGFGSARLLQGDSRQLSEIIGSADLVCSSPPFQSSMIESGDPKYAHKFHGSQKDYGSSPGQLGRMKEGVPPQVDCVVGSPPYSTDQMGGGGLKHDKVIDAMKAGYGATDGQLSAMPEGRFDAVVSSPPYEASQMEDGRKRDKAHRGLVNHPMAERTNPRYRGEKLYLGDYASQVSEGNIDNQSGDTFWSAAREIVAQCHAILRPGGHAIWVCKDFVRKGKRVAFSDQWQALCESVGFRPVCRHRAMLVQHHGEQGTIFGETERITTERKSFFRRLAEKKGSPKIDFEDVICLEARSSLNSVRK